MFTRPGTTFYSIIHSKCPRCRQGNLFIHSNPYAMPGMLDMPNTCPICGQDFQIEPGFYLGATWISYPIVIALIIGFIAIGHYIFRLHMLASFILATLLLLLLSPLLIRYSRVLYLYIFA